MQQSIGFGLAVLFFFVIVAAIAFWGQATGFWDAIPSHLRDENGPATLSPDFGVGLVTEGISAFFQIVVTVILFQLIANYPKWRIEKAARQAIGTRLIGVYNWLLNEAPNVDWNRMNSDSKFRNDLTAMKSDLLIQNHNGIDHIIIRDLNAAHTAFEKLVFRGLADEKETTASLMKEMRARFDKVLGRLGVPRDERRVELDDLEAAINNKLSQYYTPLAAAA